MKDAIKPVDVSLYYLHTIQFMVTSTGEVSEHNQEHAESRG
jgi:hypothetical protein